MPWHRGLAASLPTTRLSLRHKPAAQGVGHFPKKPRSNQLRTLFVDDQTSEKEDKHDDDEHQETAIHNSSFLMNKV